MGTLRYDTEVFEFDDRILAHLQIVIDRKLRRGERFFLGWVRASYEGSGRHMIWIDTGVPLHLTFTSNTPAVIDHEWLTELATSAHTTAGMHLERSRITATPVPTSEVPHP